MKEFTTFDYGFIHNFNESKWDFVKQHFPFLPLCGNVKLWLNEYESNGRYFPTRHGIYFELPEDAMAFQMTWS